MEWGGGGRWGVKSLLSGHGAWSNARCMRGGGGEDGGRLNVRIDRRIRLNNTRQLNIAKLSG